MNPLHAKILRPSRTTSQATTCVSDSCFPEKLILRTRGKGPENHISNFSNFFNFLQFLHARTHPKYPLPRNSWNTFNHWIRAKQGRTPTENPQPIPNNQTRNPKFGPQIPLPTLKFPHSNWQSLSPPTRPPAQATKRQILLHMELKIAPGRPKRFITILVDGEGGQNLVRLVHRVVERGQILVVEMAECKCVGCHRDRSHHARYLRRIQEQHNWRHYCSLSLFRLPPSGVSLHHLRSSPVPLPPLLLRSPQCWSLRFTAFQKPVRRSKGCPRNACAVSRGIPCLPSPPSVRPGSDLEIVRSVAAAMEIFLPSRCDRNRNAATTRERGEGRGGREIQSFHPFRWTILVRFSLGWMSITEPRLDEVVSVGWRTISTFIRQIGRHSFSSRSGGWVPHRWMRWSWWGDGNRVSSSLYSSMIVSTTRPLYSVTSPPLFNLHISLDFTHWN